MANVNSIAMRVSDYETKEDFWKAVIDFVRLLTEAKYEVAFRYEDCGVYVLEFDNDRSEGYGNSIVRWLDAEEYEIAANALEPFYDFKDKALANGEAYDVCSFYRAQEKAKDGSDLPESDVSQFADS